MPRRYLFGPVTAEFANQNLRRQREAGECLCFNATGSTDLTIQPSDTWNYICKRFPEGWQPDFIVLNLADASIPANLWSANIPIVCIAGAWQRLWHYYRLRLWTCELILTDANGVEAFQRQGLPHTRTVGVDWSASVEVIEREWAGMVDRQRQRPVLQGLPLLLCRTWQALSSFALPHDPTLATDLATALTTDPHNADVHNALGMARCPCSAGPCGMITSGRLKWGER